MLERQPTVVTAGIIVKDGRILACQRHRSDRYGLQWEFPGGKVLEGEGLEAALKRELWEELGIRAQVGQEVFRLRYRYPDRYVEVVFFLIPAFEGTVQNLVFEEIAWAERESLSKYNFLEADRELVGRIARGEIV